MSTTDLNPQEQYYFIPNYTMKCRLYPNKVQRQAIDAAIYSVGRTYNMVQYDMVHNRNMLNRYDKDPENVAYFANIRGAVKKDYIHQFLDGKAPNSAITGNNGVIQSDLHRHFLGDLTVRKGRSMLPVDKVDENYYSKSRPRRSYTYQETFGKIARGENPKVFYISLAKINNSRNKNTDRIEVRGINQRLRFGANHEFDFLSYAEMHPKDCITITILKDNCDDYFISFKFTKSMLVAKPMKISDSDSSVGVDMGIHDVMITSSGQKFKNQYFRRNKKQQLAVMSRQLSRMQGWQNESFRNLADQSRENGVLINPSKKYQKKRLKRARLERKLTRQNANYVHHITHSVVAENNFIGVETLNITGMFRNRRLSSALRDATMGSALEYLKYKSDWYGRTIQPIDMWTPSSKKCNCCGYINQDLTLSMREWDCPSCGTHHDRDINAAKNILFYAYDALEQEYVPAKKTKQKQKEAVKTEIGLTISELKHLTSKSGKKRYGIFDSSTDELLDDAQGYGYSSIRKAKNTRLYKEHKKQHFQVS